MRRAISMDIYTKKVNYRKIYESHYGSIPRDEQGRTYDIHHIDGDRTNNSIENLMAVSIAEHYRIHHAQKDWGACVLIANKMKKTPEELSILASLNAKKLLEEGDHIFQDSEFIQATSERNKKLAEVGEHPWQSDEFIERNRQVIAERQKQAIE